MKQQLILGALFVLGVFSLAVPATHASSITMIGDTAIITLDFGFSATGGDYEVPVIASSTVGYFDRVDELGYSVTGADIVSASGLVLSQASLSENNRYAVNNDDSATFTVFIIAKLANITDELTATITKIPYWVNGTRTTVHENQLNELEPAI